MGARCTHFEIRLAMARRDIQTRISHKGGAAESDEPKTHSLSVWRLQV